MHTGQWQGRDRMAWLTWWFGILLSLAGAVGLLMGKDSTGMLVINGCGLVTMVFGIKVAGKVQHDKNMKAGPDVRP